MWSSTNNTPLRDLASCAYSFISKGFERNSASRCRQLLVALMLLSCSVMLLPCSFKMCPHSFACSLVFVLDFWSGTPSTKALSFTGLFLHQSCRSTKPRILIHGQRLLLSPERVWHTRLFAIKSLIYHFRFKTRGYSGNATCHIKRVFILIRPTNYVQTHFLENTIRNNYCTSVEKY